MVRRQPYTLVYAPDVRHHLRAVERQFYSLIREAIEEQLLFQPDTETRNRKPLRQPALLAAQWELRFGPDKRLVVGTRNGRPVAALLAVRDDEELERLVLAHSPRLRSILETTRQQIREGEGVGHQDFWRKEEEEQPAEGSSRSRRGRRGAGA
jgi:pimeloyl-ACP methyl ester carboxylesterase